MTRSEPGPPLTAWWSGFAAVAAAYLVTAFVVAWLAIAGADPDTPSTVIAGTYVQDLVLFVMALGAAHWFGRGPLLAALGWGAPTGWRRACLITIAAGALYYAAGAAYGTLVEIKDASGSTVESLGLTTSTAAVIAATPLLTVVAPLVEETVFRGLLFGALWRWRGWLFGALVSGVTFGGIHAGGAATEALPVLALFGFVLAALYRFTGSLLPSIALHAVNNAVTLAVTLDWSAVGTVAVVVAAPATSVTLAWAALAARARRAPGETAPTTRPTPVASSSPEPRNKA